MNSTTLRRLASDHASLHKVDLPPYFLFPSSNASIPDDLTQLTILLTGPQGTPYSEGLWKLHLKIPLDYPKSPPKASFRTKIWHPNVDETTGSVCLDTLKRDWQPKLTLRDILITISCLLIHPNPDSALNAGAGKLLQEDYEAFARQAKLMTSIHAVIPTSMKEAVLEARGRGEDKAEKEKDVRTALISQGEVAADEEGEREENDDEASASKENDPSLSPSPVTPVSNIRRPLLGKRPLSDLPTPLDTDDEEADNLTSSERNIAANTPNLSSNIACMSVSSDVPRRSLKLAERSRSFNFANRSAESTETAHITPYEDAMDQEQPAPKRVCSGEGKENVTEVKEVKPPGAPKPAPLVGLGVKTTTSSDLRKVSTASTSSTGSSKNGKPRIGLRRL